MSDGLPFSRPRLAARVNCLGSDQQTVPLPCRQPHLSWGELCFTPRLRKGEAASRTGADREWGSVTLHRGGGGGHKGSPRALGSHRWACSGCETQGPTQLRFKSTLQCRSQPPGLPGSSSCLTVREAKLGLTRSWVSLLPSVSTPGEVPSPLTASVSPLELVLRACFK